jgi:hypothetical protein
MKKLIILSLFSLMLTTLTYAQQIRGEQIKNNTVPLNVKDFGAVGDGSTSDYSSFLTALNRSNAVVTIPNGTYKIDNIINLNNVSNLRITGNSGATLQGTKHIIISLGGNCTNVEVDGITFTTTATDSTVTDYYGLLTDTGSFTNLYIHNCSFSSPYCQTEGVKVVCEGTDRASDLNIQNCNFTNIGLMGIELQSHTDTTTFRLNNINISNNYFNNMGAVHSQPYGMAISISGIGKGAVITGNVIIDPIDIGIESAGWSDVTIANNTIRSQKNSAFNGINATDNGSEHAYPRRVAITGNVIDNMVGYSSTAINTANLTGFSISGNEIRTGGSGIGVFTSYDGVINSNSVIAGTSTTSSGGNGLLFSGSSNNIASGNYFDLTEHGNYALAIYYNASGGTIYSMNNVVTPDNVIRLNSTGIAFTAEAGSTNNSMSLGDDPITAANNANYTVPRSKLYITLPVISANYTVTVPNPASYPGESLFIQDSNTSGSTWTFTGSVVNAAGTAISTLVNSTFYQLKSNGSNWVKMN